MLVTDFVATAGESAMSVQVVVTVFVVSDTDVVPVEDDASGGTTVSIFTIPVRLSTTMWRLTLDSAGAGFGDSVDCTSAVFFTTVSEAAGVVVSTSPLFEGAGGVESFPTTVTAGVSSFDQPGISANVLASGCAVSDVSAGVLRTGVLAVVTVVVVVVAVIAPVVVLAAAGVGVAGAAVAAAVVVEAVVVVVAVAVVLAAVSTGAAEGVGAGVAAGAVATGGAAGAAGVAAAGGAPVTGVSVAIVIDRGDSRSFTIVLTAKKYRVPSERRFFSKRG